MVQFILYKFLGQHDLRGGGLKKCLSLLRILVAPPIKLSQLRY